MKNFLLAVVLGICSSGISIAMGKEPEEPGCMANETFDEKKCRQQSPWVAVGRIADVVRRQQNPEPSKFDFVEFRFIVQEWEKGKMKQKEIPHLRIFPSEVEWPSETEGLFRVYVSKTILFNKPYKYRVEHIEKLGTGR